MILFIECPVSEDGMERFACPTADRMGRYHCIDDHVLCDGFIDCPTGEDEDRQACMFYKTVSRNTCNFCVPLCVSRSQTVPQIANRAYRQRRARTFLSSVSLQICSPS